MKRRESKARVFDIAIDCAFYVAFGDGLFFVKGVFTAAKRDFHLDERAFKI